MATGTSTSNSHPELNDELAAELGLEAVVGAEENPGVVSEAEVESAEAEDATEAAPVRRRFLLFNAMPSWVISMALHVVLLLILALMYIETPENITQILKVAPPAERETIEEFEMIDQMEPVDVAVVSSQPVMQAAATVPTEVTEVSPVSDLDAAPVKIDLVEFSDQTAPKNDLMKEIGSVTGSGLEGRGMAARGSMIAKYGGSEGSEKAVAAALRWLAEHQLPNGSWSFDHRGGRCQGRCSEPGSLNDCFTGATAMALLPFLGSGQTHKEGQYRGVVFGGLNYLLQAQDKRNGSLVQGGGSLYSHGLAAIVLCEAYAMTQDRQLLLPSQAALAFISYAQDPVGGGWRYAPKQPGDTSVVGWQLMALKSGHMAHIVVPPSTVAGASKFLDTVQSDYGAKYGYASPGAKASTTAIGLLCRMYLGWKKDHPALQQGVDYLSSTGPSSSDMYFNYYATQVMRHFEGDYWNKWNSVMRDQLVSSQNQTGHMTGSWDPVGGGHVNERGGRLYFTSMATMILEVYYRHLPIYGKDAAEEDFPL